ncbi:MAG: AgmX/PglI C-terminal domain-containing protein [Myxococcota bacterium]
MKTPEQRQNFQDATDRIFLLCLLLSALLHTVGGILAVTIELPPPSSQADYTAWVKRLADTPEIEEVVEETKPEEKPEEEDEDQEAEKEAKEDKPTAKPQGKPSKVEAERREQVREAVKSVGILGLIGTADEGGDLANVFDSSSDVVGQNIQQALESQTELSSSNRDFRKRGTGKVGDIGDVEVADGGGVGGGKLRKAVAPKAFVKSSEAKSFGGQVDNRKLNRILKRVQNDVETCYKLALKSNRGLKGSILVRWTITPAGKATNVKIARDTMGSSQVVSCVKASISRKSYRGVVQGNAPVVVQKSFSFGSTS